MAEHRRSEAADSPEDREVSRLDDVLRQLEETQLSAGLQLALMETVPPASTEQIDDAQRRLGVDFHPDYRRFLEVASHRVFGPLEPAVVSLPGSKLDLVDLARRAWDSGTVPRDRLAICRHGDGHFCLDREGRVDHWRESVAGGASVGQTWPNLASWLSEMALSSPVRSSGNDRIDEIVSGVIDLFEANFPGRVCSYLLEGSHADGQVVISSDIDLTLLFETQPDVEEARRIARVREACQKLCPPLDIRVRGLDTSRRFGAYGFNLRSILMRGEDVVDQVPPTPLEDYIRICVHAPYYFMSANLRGVRAGASFPFEYPDPDGEFFGYNRPMQRSLDGLERDGLKDFIVCVLWAARAIAVLRARRYLSPRNSDAAQLYREWIGDAWTPWLEEVVATCRGTWQYVVPETASDRARLRELCEPMLEFENHYLEVYKDFLIDQLENAGKPESFWIGLRDPRPDAFDESTARLFALRRLARLRYDDDAVRAALSRALESDDPRIRKAAAEILESSSSAPS